MDIAITFKNLLSMAYTQANLESGSFSLYFPFAYCGKQCVLAMYSHGYIGDNFSRKFWPCLYMETDKRGQDYQMQILPDDIFIHGDITFGVDTLPQSGLSQHFVGCDWNHGCDSRNTFADDLVSMEKSLEGLFKFVTTPDEVLFPKEEED